jgi:hypothetical protein
MKRAAYQTPRPFNAQIYDIPTNEYCRVLIQGSPNPIVAYFNRAFANKPEGMEIGNGVLCQYKLGNRGRIEVIGHGQTIPSPVTGSPIIVPPVGSDTILSGLQVLAIP